MAILTATSNEDILERTTALMMSRRRTLAASAAQADDGLGRLSVAPSAGAGRVSKRLRFTSDDATEAGTDTTAAEVRRAGESGAWRERKHRRSRVVVHRHRPMLPGRLRRRRAPPAGTRWLSSSAASTSCLTGRAWRPAPPRWAATPPRPSACARSRRYGRTRTRSPPAASAWSRRGALARCWPNCRRRHQRPPRTSRTTSASRTDGAVAPG